MSKNDKILIASAKGGVGKSSTALGLALAFSEMGKSVLLIDCDASSRSLDLLCGNDSPALYNLGDVILERADPASAISQPLEAYPNVSFCAAPDSFQEEEAYRKTGRSLNELAGAAVRRLTECAPRDVVIVDTSSGAGALCAPELKDVVSMTLIPAEQSKTSVRAAEYAASQMERAGISNLRLVVCNFDAAEAIKGRRAGVIEMIDQSALKCAGVVPFDKRLILRQERGLLPDGKCVSQTAYRNIAWRLMGKSVPIFSGMRGYERKRSRIL